MVRNISKSLFVRAAVVALVLFCWLPAPLVSAAEPDFVGVLAIALEEEVGKDLGLSAGQREKLLELVDARESEVLELALELKGLSKAERTKRLAPFRSESETKGLALLSAEQRAKLRKIRIRREGMATLAEAEVVQQLKLTPEQQSRVAELLKERADKFEKADADTIRTVRADTERRLAAVLDDTQKAAWEAICNDGGATAGLSSSEMDKPRDDTAGQASSGTQTSGTDPVKPDAEPNATAQAEQPADGDETQMASEAAKPSELEEPSDVPAGRLRFNFRFQPWQDVLDWFAQQADLSLVLDAPPPGTFNYVDQRDYTPAEAIDLLNSVLLTKGYTLIRRGRMLMVINLEDGIPPNLVPTVPLAELDDKGEFELVSVLFQLEKLTSQEAEEEIKKLIGPQGAVVPLIKSQKIMVTETAGRLRAIRSVIERIEDPKGLASGQLQTFPLKFVDPEELQTVLRQFLEIPEGKNAADDGSIRFAVDPSGSKLIVSGKADKLSRVAEILKLVDVPGPGQVDTDLLDQAPQLEVYTITDADPESVLQVTQTLMAGLPDVRLALDPKTGHLIALATTSQHATIRSTLDQLQRDARRIEVIRLRTVDPQLAVLSITRLFGGGKEASAAAPQVDADPVSRQLLIRGTEAQIAQIRSLLEKMGESDTEDATAADDSIVRMLPLSGSAARSALERIQEIWPTMRKNKIRIVTPSAVIPTLRPGTPAEPSPTPKKTEPAQEQKTLEPKTLEPKPPEAKAPKPAAKPAPKPVVPTLTPKPAAKKEVEDRSAGYRQGGARIILVSQPAARNDAATEQADDATPTPIKPPVEPPAIIVAPGPSGIMIASEDIEALNDFEQLLTTLADGAMVASTEVTVFYLKHAKATVAAEILDQVFGGGTLAGEGGGGPGGGGLLGNLAGAALGDMGGGIVGSLLGMGGADGGLAPTGAIKITPDTRLNALIVQANPADLDTIEQLLKILDRKESPEEILAIPKARLVPVLNTQAEEVAEIVKQVYQDRMVASSSQGAKRPSPQEFVRMLRGGRSQGKGSKSAAEDTQKMSIGVDPRTNSLIVAAPDSLFQEVKQLVEQLDQAAIESSQSVRVITLDRTNPEAVRQALSAIAGESVKFGKTATATKPKQPSTSTAKPPTTAPPSAQQMQDRMRQLRNMRSSSGRSSRR